MVFNPNIPTPTDIPSQSQAQLLANFSTSNTVFGINHVPFDAALNNGKHNFATLLNQAGDPATAAGELAIYAKSFGGVSTYYMRKESNGTVIQLSNVDPILFNPASTFLPGGYLLQFGNLNVIAGNNTVNFPIAFNSPPFSVTITLELLGPANTTTAYILVGTVNVNSFIANVIGGPGILRWMAIGLK